MQADVTVIDYGVGNLFSVQHALEHVGVTVQISSNVDDIRQARRLILPGVGAFGSGMRRLKEAGLDESIVEAVRGGTCLLGICLGMQLLFDSSEEFGEAEGLGLIPGRVIAIPTGKINGIPVKVPHIGWSDLQVPTRETSWVDTPLAQTSELAPVYFVHSFMADPDNPEHRIANCDYGNCSIAAMVGYGNVWGAQFHPERSGTIGLNILKQFTKLNKPEQHQPLNVAA